LALGRNGPRHFSPVETCRYHERTEFNLLQPSSAEHKTFYANVKLSHPIFAGSFGYPGVFDLHLYDAGGANKRRTRFRILSRDHDINFNTKRDKMNACTLTPPLSPHQEQQALAAIWYDNITLFPPRIIARPGGGYRFEPWSASAGIGSTSSTTGRRPVGSRRRSRKVRSPDDVASPPEHSGDGADPRRMWTLKQVQKVIPLSRSTIERMMKRGEFPQQHPMSPGRRGWYVDEIVEHQRRNT
jgi:predicted DNA-binding transcriptional regulator AlpA